MAADIYMIFVLSSFSGPVDVDSVFVVIFFVSDEDLLLPALGGFLPLIKRAPQLSHSTELGSFSSPQTGQIIN